MRWPKEIQVKELQRPRGGVDTLDRFPPCMVLEAM
jgi:hypothetical protein